LCQMSAILAECALWRHIYNDPTKAPCVRQGELDPNVFVTDLDFDPHAIPGWGDAGVIDKVCEGIRLAGMRCRPTGNGTDFSIIIPTRGSSPRMDALRSVLGCRVPNGGSIECILALGNHPSVQRNRAISLAKGSLVGFLDDDCLVPTDWLERSASVISQQRADIVGGPNVTPAESSFFGKCVGEVLSSRLGTAMMRARYRPVGSEPERSGDGKTALCNMVFEKSIFDEFRFNEEMFPNEENELLSRVIEDGYTTVYDPRLAVQHPRKTDLKGFARQAYGYGHGRADQTKIQPRSLRPIHLMPSLTFLGAITLPAIALAGPTWLVGFLALCLASYLALVIASSAAIAAHLRSAKALLLSSVLYPALHFSYGLGFALGLLGLRGKRQPNQQRVWLLRFTASNASPTAASEHEGRFPGLQA